MRCGYKTKTMALPVAEHDRPVRHWQLFSCDPVLAAGLLLFWAPVVVLSITHACLQVLI